MAYKIILYQGFHGISHGGSNRRRCLTAVRITSHHSNRRRPEFRSMDEPVEKKAQALDEGDIKLLKSYVRTRAMALHRDAGHWWPL